MPLTPLSPYNLQGNLNPITTMQTMTLSKDKTPEIKDWATDKEPGDRVCLYGTIKANDDQTLTITVEEIGDDHHNDDDEAAIGGNEGSSAAPDGPPVGTMAALGDGEDAP